MTPALSVFGIVGAAIAAALCAVTRDLSRIDHWAWSQQCS